MFFAKPSKARRRLAKIHISAHNTEGTDQVEQAKSGGDSKVTWATWAGDLGALLYFTLSYGGSKS